MRTTKIFLLAVTVCVASANAFTLRETVKDLDNIMLLATFVKETKNLVDDLKNTTFTQPKTVTDFVNMVRNVTASVMQDYKLGRYFLLRIIFREIRPFVKPLIGSLFDDRIVLPNKNNSILPGSITDNSLKNPENSKEENDIKNTVTAIPDHNSYTTGIGGESNESMDSASLEKTSQSKEVEEHAGAVTLPADESSSSESQN